jgi:hypothetical protein
MSDLFTTFQTGIVTCHSCNMTINACLCVGGSVISGHDFPVHGDSVFTPPPGKAIRFDGPVKFTEPTIAKELLILLERLGDDATIADLRGLLRSIIVEHALKTQGHEQGIETNTG